MNHADALLVDVVGSILNHELFWESIKPGGRDMSPAVKTLIEFNFSSVDQLKQRITSLAKGITNSGWIFLVIREGKLEIMHTRNGGTVYGQTGIYPLLALDLYEHSYLYDYDNRKDEYVKNWFFAIDWEGFEERANQIAPEVW